MHQCHKSIDNYMYNVFIHVFERRIVVCLLMIFFIFVIITGVLTKGVLYIKVLILKTGILKRTN